jgi:hypothetical protein
METFITVLNVVTYISGGAAVALGIYNVITIRGLRFAMKNIASTTLAIVAMAWTAAGHPMPF